jgi:predicted amidophosphoribosyltransferase
LSKICKIPVNNDFIVRSKYTKQQSHLSQSWRAKNLSWVFSLKSNTIDKNTTLYLVDDVISTGGTVLEITRLLHENWYKNVRVMCLASD